MRATRRRFLAALTAGLGTPRVLSAAFQQPPPPPHEVPWLGEAQRPPVPLPTDAPTLRPLLVDGDGVPITTRSGWEKQREVMRKWWIDFLRIPPIARDNPPELKIIAEDRDQGVVRQLVRYEVEPRLTVDAYLLRPERSRESRPGVVVFHSTVNHSIRQPAGVQGSAEKAFGLKLAQQGYVTFCPRNFLWPDNTRIAAQQQTERFQQRHPNSKGMGKMLLDALIAVDILASQPEVDTRRLGAIGHSLGAKEVLYLAAFDQRIRVTVSSEGGIGTRFSNWDAPWYLGEQISRPEFQHEHHELLSLVAPRPFLLLGGDSADGSRSWPFIEAVLPVYRLYTGLPRLALVNHQQGHSVPPESERRIEEWFATYL